MPAYKVKIQNPKYMTAKNQDANYAQIIGRISCWPGLKMSLYHVVAISDCENCHMSV